MSTDFQSLFDSLADVSILQAADNSNLSYKNSLTFNDKLVDKSLL